MATYKLIYFNLKGRAELTRLIFNLAGQPFEDNRIEFSDWSKLKNTFSFKQLPVLEVTETDGKVTRIAQSNSIVRFVASRFGLDGKNDLERASCDMICEQIRDIFDSLIHIFLIKNEEEKSSLFDKNVNEKIPDMYRLIQNLLETNKSGFLVGNDVTYTDLALVLSYDWLRDRKEDVLAKLPGLKEHEAKIRAIPRVADHLKKHEKDRLTILF
jgi:glutathione S-transferase